MPVVYSQEELRPLLDSPEEWVNAIDAVEELLIKRHQAGKNGYVFFTDLLLDGENNSFKVYGVTGPGNASLRVFPGETNEGSNADAAYYMILDPVSGGLVAMLAGDDLNTLRTSVPAGVGARHLAPEGASVLTVLGSSAQARSHARVITSALPDLKEVVVWSPTPANREQFAAEQTKVLGVPVRAVETAEEAVGLGDVVTAAGRLPGGTAAYEAGWVKPGALAISMTGSAPMELRESGQFVVPTTNRPQIVAIGFAGAHRPNPKKEDPDDVVQLADVIAGDAKARESDDQPVVFELAQVYPWDHAIADWAYAWARKNAKGTEFTLSQPG